MKTTLGAKRRDQGYTPGPRTGIFGPQPFTNLKKFPSRTL